MNHQCVPCITAKARRSPVLSSTRKTSRPLELVHLDISVPVEPSIEKLLYTVAFLDDNTAKSDVYLLKAKSELFNTLHEYKARSETELQCYGYKLTNVKMDRAGEKMSNSVCDLCKHHGIGMELEWNYLLPTPSKAMEMLKG